MGVEIGGLLFTLIGTLGGAPVWADMPLGGAPLMVPCRAAKRCTLHRHAPAPRAAPRPPSQPVQPVRRQAPPQRPKVEIFAVPAVVLQPVVPGKEERDSVVKVGCCGGVCGGGGAGPGPQMAGRKPLAAQQGAVYSESGGGGMRRPERDRGFTLEAGLWPDELNFGQGPDEGEIPEDRTPRPALAEQPPREAESPAPPVHPELGGVVAQVGDRTPAAVPAFRDEAVAPLEDPAGGALEARAEPEAPAPNEADAEEERPAGRARILDELFPPAFAGVPVK